MGIYVRAVAVCHCVVVCRRKLVGSERRERS